MNIPDNINILGTEYKIVLTERNNDVFNGFDSTFIVQKHNKEIFIATEGLCDGIIKRSLTNCIIRIFLLESGIHANSINNWAMNNEMYGWMALQFYKILHVIKEFDNLQKELTEVMILGVKYKISYCKDVDSDSEFSANPSTSAYIDYYEKNIVIKEELDIFFLRTTLLHELIHGFLFESGLNSESTDDWAENEEMIDWFALQFKKIAKVVATII
mgnify:CR=1 FL=1